MEQRKVSFTGTDDLKEALKGNPTNPHKGMTQYFMWLSEDEATALKTNLEMIETYEGRDNLSEAEAGILSMSKKGLVSIMHTITKRKDLGKR